MTPSLVVLLGAFLTQDAKATLENCALEEGRWVCRYRLPDVQLVQGSTPVNPPVVEQRPLEAASTPPPVAALDPGVLSEEERRLVNRCADAGWVSLCSKGDRQQAQTLKASAERYEQTRVSVGKMLSTGQCDAAVSEALAGGYLALAREARGFCAK